MTTPSSCDWCQALLTCGFHAGFSGALSGRLKETELEKIMCLRQYNGVSPLYLNLFPQT